MFPFINIPVFLFNTTTCFLALRDIYQNYKNSKFLPRLIMTALIIFGAYPSSFLVVFSCFIRSDLLSYKPVCYIYMTVNWFDYLIPLSLFSLSIFVSLIMFAKFKRERLNKIGKCLIVLIFVGFGIIQFIVLPISGANPRRKFNIMGTGLHFRYCEMKDAATLKMLFSSTTITSILTLITAILILTLNLVRGRLGTATSNGRLILSFILFSLTNFWYLIRFYIREIMNIHLPQTVEFVISDFTKIAPGAFALIYLILDAYTRKKPIDFSLKKILTTKRLKKQFKLYLLTSSDKYKYNLLIKWEEVSKSDSEYFTMMGEKNLGKLQALALLEKNLELDLTGFLMSEEWTDFYEEYRKLSSLDDQFMENLEVDISKE